MSLGLGATYSQLLRQQTEQSTKACAPTRSDLRASCSKKLAMACCADAMVQLRPCGSTNVVAGQQGPKRLPAHVDRLSSINNDFVKHVVKLRESSSYRHHCGLVVITGDAPLRELCAIAPSKLGAHASLNCLFVLENITVPPELAEFTKRVVRVTTPVMHKLCGLESASQINMVGLLPLPISFISLQHEEDALSALSKWCSFPERLLVLDTIQDPGNLGTLLRTAAAFNWDGIFLLNGCCDPFNEKALRASRGSCFWIPIAVGHWSQLQPFLASKRIKLFAGEPHQTKCNQHTESLSIIAEEESLCLILGSEGQGLSEDVRAACNLISIPMPGKFESLNVAVAGGIFLFMLQKWKPENFHNSFH